MLKRTKGRLLITLLVITGLAGTMKQSSLLPQERRLAVRMFKDNRDEIINNLPKLSDQQLQFEEGGKSIAAYISKMNHTEKEVWALFEKAMSQPATPPEMRLKLNFSDEDILEKMTLENSLPLLLNIPAFSQNATTAKGILTDLKKQRTLHIRYLRSSTEDLRNHFVQTASGPIDCYQLTLLLANYQHKMAESIKQIMESPSFPTH